MQKKKFNFKISLSQIQNPKKSALHNNSLVQASQTQTSPHSQSYISLPLQSNFNSVVQSSIPATTKSSSFIKQQRSQQYSTQGKNIQLTQLKQSIHSRNLYNTCRSSSTSQQQKNVYIGSLSNHPNQKHHHLNNRPQFTSTSSYKSRPLPHPDNQYNPKLPSNNTSASSSSNSSFLFSQYSPKDGQKNQPCQQQISSRDGQQQDEQQLQQPNLQKTSIINDQTTCISSMSGNNRSNRHNNTTHILGIRQILERQQKLNNSSTQMRTSMSLLKSYDDDDDDAGVYYDEDDEQEELQKLLKEDSKTNTISCFSESITSNCSSSLDSKRMKFSFRDQKQEQKNKVKAVLNINMKKRGSNKRNNFVQSNSNGDSGVSFTSSNSKIINSSGQSIPPVQLSRKGTDYDMRKRNLNQAHQPCNTSNNSNSNLLNEDDLTMELSSNNTTIFNYSSNEKGQKIPPPFASNNFTLTNGANNIKARYSQKDSPQFPNKDSNQNYTPVQQQQEKEQQQLLDFREYTQSRKSNNDIDLLQSLDNEDMNQLLRLSVSTSNADMKPSSILQSNKSSFCGNSARSNHHRNAYICSNNQPTTDGQVNFSGLKPPSLGTKSDFSPLNSSCNGNSPELIYDSVTSQNTNRITDRINSSLQLALQSEKYQDSNSSSSNQILAFGFEKQYQSSLGHNSSCESNGKLSSGNSTPVGNIQVTYTVASSHGSVIDDACCVLEQNRLDDVAIKTQISQDNLDNSNEQQQQLMIKEKLHQQQMMYYNNRCKHSIYSTIFQHPDQQESQCPASRQSHIDLLNEQFYSQVSRKNRYSCNNNTTQEQEQDEQRNCRDIHSILGKSQNVYFSNKNESCDEQQTSPVENLITFQGVTNNEEHELITDTNHATAEFQTQKRSSSSIPFAQENQSTINYQSSIERPNQNRPVSRLDVNRCHLNSSTKEQYFQFQGEQQSQEMLRKPIVSQQKYPQMPQCSASPFIEQCILTESSPQNNNPSILQLMLMSSSKNLKEQKPQEQDDTIISHKNTAQIKPVDLLKDNYTSTKNFQTTKQITVSSSQSSSSTCYKQNSASQFSCSRNRNKNDRSQQFYDDICKITQQSQRPDELIAQAIDGVSIQQDLANDDDNQNDDINCYEQTADFRTNNALFPPLSGSVSQNLTRIQSSSTVRAITPKSKNQKIEFDNCSPILLGHILKNSQRGKRRKSHQESSSIVNESVITLHMHSDANNSDCTMNQNQSVATQKKLDEDDEHQKKLSFQEDNDDDNDDNDDDDEDDYEEHIVGDQFNRDSLLCKKKLGSIDQSQSSIELQGSDKYIKKTKKRRQLNQEDVRSSLMPCQKFGVIPIIDIKSKKSSSSSSSHNNNANNGDNMHFNTVECHLNTSNQINLTHSTPNSGRMALVFSSDSKRRQNLPKKQLFLGSQMNTCAKQNLQSQTRTKKNQRQINIENVLKQNTNNQQIQHKIRQQKYSINRRSTLSQVHNTCSPPFKNVQNTSHNTVASRKMIPLHQPLSSSSSSSYSSNNQKLFDFYKKQKKVDCTIKPKNPLTLYHKKVNSKSQKPPSSLSTSSNRTSLSAQHNNNYQSSSSCSSRIGVSRRCQNSSCTTPSKQKQLLQPYIRNKQNNSKLSLGRTETTHDEISRVDNLMMLDISINSANSKQQQQFQSQQLNSSIVSDANYMFSSKCGQLKQNKQDSEDFDIMSQDEIQKMIRQLQYCNQELRKKEKQAQVMIFDCLYKFDKQNYQRQLKLKDKVIEQLQKQNQSLHIELAQAYCQLQEQNQKL